MEGDGLEDPGGNEDPAVLISLKADNNATGRKIDGEEDDRAAMCRSNQANNEQNNC